MKPTLRSTSLLDRQSEKRSDDDYLAALAGGPDARIIVLTDHKPVIRSNEARTEFEPALVHAG